MKILFDARVLGKQMHGIARYCLNLLQQLLAEDGDNEYLVLIGQAQIRERFIPSAPVRWIQTSIPLYSIQEQFLIPMRVRKEVFDLFHSPTYSIPLVLAKKGIITIHDLIHLIFPRDYSLGHRLFYRLIVRRAVSRCPKVFTVSEKSKDDIVSFLQGHKERIVITPNGLDPHWAPKPLDTEFNRRYGLDQGYLVFVGNPKPHKNFFRVLSAFEVLVKEDHYPGKLVAIGIPSQQLSAEVRDRVLCLPHSNDEDLGLFYSGAELLLAPSLYEGFGLPVLEAMACGCPVLIGNQGALPEIAGDIGLQVDPNQVSSIVNGVRQVLRNKTLSQKMREQGLNRAARYTWEKTAGTVLETYDSLNTIL